MFSKPNFFLYCFLIGANVLPTGEVAHAQRPDNSRKFVVDGITLGSTLRIGDPALKEFSCSPSTQFSGFTFCQRRKLEQKAGESISITTSIMHATDGRVTYINRFVDPAFFTQSEIDDEVSRLSNRHGAPQRVLHSQHRDGVAQGRIVQWGSLQLAPLSTADLSIVREGRSPGKGILVDFLGNFTSSAKADLPVYKFDGDQGFVWVPTFDENGRGRLRFFAIDAARLSAAHREGPRQEQSAPSASGDQRNDRQREAAETLRKDQHAQLERQLEECGESCPDKPELDKARQDAEKLLEQSETEADDAFSFLAAMGNEDAFNSYLSSCDYKTCNFRTEATVERDNLRRLREGSKEAEAEERRFQAARGSSSDLKSYVADCQICAFAATAVTEINEIAEKERTSIFQLEVCNKDYLPAFVAFAGKPEPSSDMWVAEGWYTLKSGECRTIATLAKGAFYVHAYNKRGTWTGNGASGFCVSDQAFTRVLLTEEDRCAAGEYVRKFGEMTFESASAKYTWTLNAIPWTYAAMAYSPSDSSWGWATGHSTAEGAQQAALAGCASHAFDCRVGRWVRDEFCLALAKGSNRSGGTALGWAYSDDRNVARDRALNGCREYGNGCYVIKDSCTR